MEAARRELLEEIGASAIELIPMGLVYTSTALTSENLKLFIARIDSVGLPQREEGIDSIHLIGRDEIDRHLLDGTICDGPTTTAITRARLRGLL
jgi:ADP-ribose pyrophosphatase